jgi:hypothetical protein
LLSWVPNGVHDKAYTVGNISIFPASEGVVAAIYNFYFLPFPLKDIAYEVACRLCETQFLTTVNS